MYEWYKTEDMIKCLWADSKIGDKGAVIIGEALKTNSTVTELQLHGNEK